MDALQRFRAGGGSLYAKYLDNQYWITTSEESGISTHKGYENGGIIYDSNEDEDEDEDEDEQDEEDLEEFEEDEESESEESIDEE